MNVFRLLAFIALIALAHNLALSQTASFEVQGYRIGMSLADVLKVIQSNGDNVWLIGYDDGRNAWQGDHDQIEPLPDLVGDTAVDEFRISLKNDTLWAMDSTVSVNATPVRISNFNVKLRDGRVSGLGLGSEEYLSLREIGAFVSLTNKAALRMVAPSDSTMKLMLRTIDTLDVPMARANLELHPVGQWKSQVMGGDGTAIPVLVETSVVRFVMTDVPPDGRTIRNFRSMIVVTIPSESLFEMLRQLEGVDVQKLLQGGE